MIFQKDPTSLPRKRTKFEIKAKNVKKKYRDRRREKKLEAQAQQAGSTSALGDEQLVSDEEEWEDVVVEENSEAIGDAEGDDSEDEEMNDDINNS